MDKNNRDHQISKLLHESGIQLHCSQMLNALFSKDTDILDPAGVDDDYHWYIKSIYDINEELKAVAQSVLSNKIQRLNDPQKADYLIRKEWAAYLYEYFRSRSHVFMSRHAKMYDTLKTVLVGLSHLKARQPELSLSQGVNAHVLESNLQDIQTQINRVKVLQEFLRQNNLSHSNQSIHIFHQLIKAGHPNDQEEFGTQHTQAFKDYLLERRLSVSEAQFEKARHVFDFLSLYSPEESKGGQFFKFEEAINTFCSGDADEAALRQFEGSVLFTAFEVTAFEHEQQASINELHQKLFFSDQLTEAIKSFQDPIILSQDGPAVNVKEKKQAVLESVKSKLVTEQSCSVHYTESLFKLSLLSNNNERYTNEQVCLHFLNAVNGKPFYELSVEEILKSSSAIFNVKSSGNPDFALSQFVSQVYKSESVNKALNQLKTIYPKPRDQMVAFINMMRQPKSSRKLSMAVLMTMPDSDQTLFWNTVSEYLEGHIHSFEDLLRYNIQHDLAPLFQRLERNQVSNQALVNECKARLVQYESGGVQLNAQLLGMQQALRANLAYVGIQSSGNVGGDSLVSWLSFADQVNKSEESLATVTPIDLTKGSIHQQLDAVLKQCEVEKSQLEAQRTKANDVLYKAHQLYDVLGLFFSVYDQVIYKKRSWGSLSINAHHRKHYHAEGFKFEDDALLVKVFEAIKTDSPRESYEALVTKLVDLNQLVASYQTMGQQQLLNCLYTGVNKQNQSRFIKSISEIAEEDFKFQSTKTPSKIAELIEYYFQMTQQPHHALAQLLVQKMPQAEILQLMNKADSNLVSAEDIVVLLETHPDMARVLAEKYLIPLNVLEIIFHLKDIEIARKCSDHAFLNYQLYKNSPALFYEVLSYEVASKEVLGFFIRNFAPNLMIPGVDEGQSLEGHIDTFIINSLNGFKLPKFENALSFLFVMCAFIAFWYSLSNPVGLFMGSIFIGCSIIFNTQQQTDQVGIVSYLSKSVFSANFDYRLSDLLELVWDEKAQLDSFLKILNEISHEAQPNMLRWFEEPGLGQQNLDQCLSKVNATGSSLSARLRSLGDYQRIKLFNYLGLLKSKPLFKDIATFHERIICEDEKLIVMHELQKRFPNVSKEYIASAMLKHAPCCVEHDQKRGISFDPPKPSVFKGLSLFSPDQILNVCVHLKTSENIEKQLLSLEDASEIQVRPEFKYTGLDALPAQDQKLLLSQTTIGGIRSLVGLSDSCLGNNLYNRRFALQVLNDYRQSSDARLATNRVMPLGALTKGLFTQESALPWYYNDYNSSKGSSL